MATESIATLSLDRYDPEARGLIVAAQALADEWRHAEVAPLHLLVGALSPASPTRAVFGRATSQLPALSQAAEQALGRLPALAEPAVFSLSLIDLMQRAERAAVGERAPVGCAHLLGALGQEVRGPTGELLGAFELGPGSLTKHLAALSPTRPQRRPVQAGPLLDLSAAVEADSQSRIVARDTELVRALSVLERKTKRNLLLVGEAGVGKATLVRGLSQELRRPQLPERLRDLRFYRLDLAAVAAGARLRSDVEQRSRRALEPLLGDATSALVLFGLQQLLSQGSPFGPLLDWLGSAIERGQLRLVATATPEGERLLSERGGPLSEGLTRLPVVEPDEAGAVAMARASLGAFEDHHGVRFDSAAIVSAVTLAKRYVSTRCLPDSCLDLLDEAAAHRRVVAGASEVCVATAPRAPAEASPGEAAREASPAASPPRVTEQDVAHTLFTWTGVPASKLLQAEAEKLATMEAHLRRRVIGQDEALSRVAKAVRRSRVGLRDPGRPIGSFLFLGPSGVGKTELAKALAAFLFDDERALLRMDMSEYMERHMAQRLLGAPPGYADSERGGVLTEAVRERPYSVLLFDEVEKAHQDVFNLLLQVLDDGRLTDGRGRVADFTNTVVILTSNIGSSEVLAQAELAGPNDTWQVAARDLVVEQLRAFFRPEFLNRVGDTVVFRPLSRQHLLAIVEIQLSRVRGLLAGRGLSLELTAGAKQQLVELGFEPGLGARPLQRAVIEHVQDPLAEALLAGRLGAGDVARIDVAPEGKGWSFEVVSEPAVQRPGPGDKARK